VDIYDDQYTQQQILSYAGAVESLSEHPIGKSIVTRVKADKIELPQVDDFQAIKEKGVRGVVKGKKNQVEGGLAGSISLSDTIRPESCQAIKALHKLDIKYWMLT